MHRKPELLRLIGDWLELELESTCVSLDQFTSVEVKHFGKRITFTKKLRGKEDEIAGLYFDQVGGLTGLVISGDTTLVMSLMLFSLEKAIETF